GPTGGARADCRASSTPPATSGRTPGPNIGPATCPPTRITTACPTSGSGRTGGTPPPRLAIPPIPMPTRTATATRSSRTTSTIWPRRGVATDEVEPTGQRPLRWSARRILNDDTPQDPGSPAREIVQVPRRVPRPVHSGCPDFTLESAATP